LKQEKRVVGTVLKKCSKVGGGEADQRRFSRQFHRTHKPVLERGGSRKGKKVHLPKRGGGLGTGRKRGGRGKVFVVKLSTLAKPKNKCRKMGQDVESTSKGGLC